MARKKDSKDLLTGREKVQGWRDQFADGKSSESESDPTRKSSPKYRRKTYLMTDELIERIEAQADKANVGINEMNRYLLTVALDLVESGKHEVQVQTIQKSTLGV